MGEISGSSIPTNNEQRIYVTPQLSKTNNTAQQNKEKSKIINHLRME